MRVAGVILAAGASRRLGMPKQLAVVGGERLLERAVRTAREAGCDPVVVVLGAGAERIAAECRLGVVRVVQNPAWAEGMGSSLRLGVASLGEACDAVVVMTCDQPAVTAEHLRKLIERCAEKPVASAYAERQGVPACFPAGSFDALLCQTGDLGARELLRDADSVPLELGELDVDTVEMLERVRSIFG
jgi:molybdenum cofactor cytidylyltransferase